MSKQHSSAKTDEIQPRRTTARSPYNMHVQDVIGTWLKTFEHESVLRESARVCVAT